MPYKAICKIGKVRGSARIEGRGKVIYEPGIPTHPPKWLEEKGYGLLYFETYEQAHRFVYEHCGIYGEIWKVWPENEVASLPPISNCLSVEYGKIEPTGHRSWPEGSHMAMELTLLELVYPPDSKSN
jgi:hypothetical protein